MPITNLYLKPSRHLQTRVTKILFSLSISNYIFYLVSEKITNSLSMIRLFLMLLENDEIHKKEIQPPNKDSPAFLDSTRRPAETNALESSNSKLSLDWMMSKKFAFMQTCPSNVF